MAQLRYKEIYLTQGKVTLVDVEDYEYLNQWKWYAIKCKNDKYYAVRNLWKDGRQITIRMHREIMEVPKGMDTDHRNGNGLDNRKKNLRVCTKAQNQMNREKASNNISGYKGVTWHKATNKWQAYTRVNKKPIYLGLYADKEQAAIAYNEAAIKLFGEFGRLNTIK